jgi:hypothetical protein
MCSGRDSGQALYSEPAPPAVRLDQGAHRADAVARGGAGKGAGPAAGPGPGPEVGEGDERKRRLDSQLAGMRALLVQQTELCLRFWAVISEGAITPSCPIYALQDPTGGGGRGNMAAAAAGSSGRGGEGAWGASPQQQQQPGGGKWEQEGDRLLQALSELSAAPEPRRGERRSGGKG